VSRCSRVLAGLVRDRSGRTMRTVPSAREVDPVPPKADDSGTWERGGAYVGSARSYRSRQSSDRSSFRRCSASRLVCQFSSIPRSSGGGGERVYRRTRRSAAWATRPEVSEWRIRPAVPCARRGGLVWAISRNCHGRPAEASRPQQGAWKASSRPLRRRQWSSARRWSARARGARGRAGAR
jgi:hypothetical protein